LPVWGLTLYWPASYVFIYFFIFVQTFYTYIKNISGVFETYLVKASPAKAVSGITFGRRHPKLYAQTETYSGETDALSAPHAQHPTIKWAPVPAHLQTAGF
jgi:hypothetical protein